MNIAEIRSKYPQYDDMSDEELARSLHRKFYADINFGDFSQKIGLQPTLQISEDAIKANRARNQAMQKEHADHWVNNPLVRSGVAAMQGVANASFNPFGYIARANGVDTKPLNPQNAVERALEKAGEYGYDAAASVLAGNKLKALGALGKGTTKTSKVLQALFAPGKEMITGSVAGGTLEGLLDPSTTAGKIAANVVGGTLGGAMGNIGKRAYMTLKGGLENIARDKDALRIVRRASKLDDDIAESVVRDAVGAAENINEASKNVLSDVLDGVSNQERYKSVKKAYIDFLERNKGKKIKGYADLKRLNPFQTKKYKKALDEGLEKAKYNTKAGEITHLLGARNVVDDMINKSYIQEFTGKKATIDTSNLVELRKKIDKLLFQNPDVKGADRSFELYHQFDDMYQRGLKYQPGSAKNVADDMALLAGGDREKALMARLGLKKGLFDKLSEKVVPSKNFAKEVKDYQNIIKKINYKQDYDELMQGLTQNETAYNRLAKLVNTAETKLSTPEASKVFAREQIESRGAALGALLDSVLGKLNSGYYKNAAKALLENEGKDVSVLSKPLLEQVIGNVLKGGAKGSSRNAQLLINKDMVDKLLQDER